MPSTNTARVTHGNAFQLCAQQNQSALCLRLLQRLWTQLFTPWGPKLLLQLPHLLSVSYFSASQGVFLDLGLVSSASKDRDVLSSHWWSCAELPWTMHRQGTKAPWVILEIQKWPFRHKTYWQVIPAMPWCRARIKSSLWHSCSTRFWQKCGALLRGTWLPQERYLQEDTALLYCKHHLTIPGQSILPYCFKWN